MNSEVVLRLKNITKTFPGVKALDNVHFEVRKGTVHGLMGENGAGKSTLMKIIIGIFQPDSGDIEYKGKPLHINNTADALNAGISMIHQELSPIPEMTVAENIFLGREPRRFGIVNEARLYEQTEKLLRDLEIHINPHTKMKDLSTAYIQMVEIAKAISYDSDLIIMDEPTSAITDREVAQLFKMIKHLKEKGVAIIYITHKMDEVFEITDECTIFRDGHYVGNEQSENLTSQDLITMMVGREVNQIFPKDNHNNFGDVILEVKNLSCKGKFENVSFQVRRGEILGFAGLMGAGRSEVMETIFGMTPKTSGDIYIQGKKVEINSPKHAINHGIGFLTEDRKRTGLFLPLSVADNTIMSDLKTYDNKVKLLDEKRINHNCESQREILKIKTPSIQQIINNLSGGNQQKVLIARWLLMDPDILIIDEPTRGIDVGAKSEIHKIMSELSKNGKAIIMVSSELPEVMGMSDRIMVMHEGKLTGEVAGIEATQEKIMEYATK
ncbi:sugar ABC transporter ATP-binding protein [Vallitalea pronyensis]|uniref:Ribose/galactose/methyl galactoside import ATP-binding protein n=1 Tax=Vallitalea pronyensis TaxID=1348613 RepID=A0A8J8MGK2_9FIRM|nr:sugar ABC transporter ATP-binding protein [Vallitalea pronyensis]QUI21156.1 sugar ABC transporter ATP-binding protein [Vallitalea pronyensis]